MIPSLVPPVIETVVRQPVLGVRFRDDATGETVRDVRARLEMPGLAEPALPLVTPSGVFAWRSLPGLGAWALGAHDDPAHLPTAEVTVDDPHGRYLAYRFRVTLPVRGLFEMLCGSPPEHVASPIESPPEPRDHHDVALPLYSLPGRPPPTGMANVRAALRRREDGAPAAYATLKLLPESGRSATGVADHRGQVVVFLPYPKIARSRGSVPSGSTPPFGSGPFRSREPLTSTTWDLTLLAGLPVRAIDGIPDLCDLLDQAPARLSVGSQPASAPTLTTASLTYGHELVLPINGEPRVLLVGP